MTAEEIKKDAMGRALKGLAILMNTHDPMAQMNLSNAIQKIYRDALDQTAALAVRPEVDALKAAYHEGYADALKDRAAPSPQRTPAPQGNQARTDSSGSGFKAPSGGSLPNTSGPAGAGAE